MRRLHPKRLEERDVLGGVAQMSSPRMTCVTSIQIVNDVHQMKHRLPSER